MKLNHYIKINNNNINYLCLFLFILIIFFLLYGTGIHSDEITEVNFILKNNLGWSDYFNVVPEAYAGTVYFRLVEYYLFYWVYFLGENINFVVDLNKAILILASIYFIFFFLKDFINKKKALLFAIIFCLYPSHDSTIFWYEVIGYNTFACAILMFSNALLRSNNLIIGVPLTFLGGFLSYSTLPYIFGLSFIFFYDKNYYKFAFFNFVGLLYLLYYFYISHYLQLSDTKISSDLSISFIFGNLILNFLGAIDAIVGPSFFYKIYLSIKNLSFLSFILSLLSTLIMSFFFKNLENNKFEDVKKLFFCFLLIFLSSILIFSLTGQYFQTPFNLGNRVTIYGTLIPAICLSIYINKKNVFIFLLIFNLCIFGLSDHWKDWNKKQNAIISKISQNNDLEKINEKDILLVNGNLYSKLGNINHIEFFVQPWLTETIFSTHVKTNKIIPLTSYLDINENFIIDKKYINKIYLDGKIYLYNSNFNSLIQLNNEELRKKINSKTIEVRHIVQLINIKFINNLIIKLNNRIEYLF